MSGGVCVLGLLLLSLVCSSVGSGEGGRPRIRHLFPSERTKQRSWSAQELEITDNGLPEHEVGEQVREGVGV